MKRDGLSRVDPLQALVDAAARRSAAGEVARTLDRARAEAERETVILADVSGSMADAAGGGRSKAEILREALTVVYPAIRRPHLVAFAAVPVTVAGPAALPSPAGGTALHLALDEAAARGPRRVLVVSDGRPDDEEAALRAAGRVRSRIDVVYCGPDDDREAVAFLSRLARASGGTCTTAPERLLDVPRLVGPLRRLLLTEGDR